jgi:hypothetical protein
MQKKNFSWVKVVFVGASLAAVSTGCGTNVVSLENASGKEGVKAIESGIEGKLKEIYESGERGVDPISRRSACCGRA